MADPLYDILVPYFEKPSSRPPPSSSDSTTNAYLARLSTLPAASLSTTEPQALAQTSQSLLLSLQALSSRSHKSVIASADHLCTLRSTLPELALRTAELRDGIPKLDEQAVRFAETFNKTAENAVLDRRRKALLLSRNVDRLADILDLPTLLSSAISSSGATSSASSTTSAMASSGYASALDLNSHIRRLHILYPESHLVSSVSRQAEEAMQTMATTLILSLKLQGLKLAAAMRTIGWLRRVAPELDTPGNTTAGNQEGGLGALFLVCRQANLRAMLDALEPLRELADQERAKTKTLSHMDTNGGWSAGQQTERYLKRYIEIFREQSFAIISMYKSIFPTPISALPEAKASKGCSTDGRDLLQPLPSALATFPLYLVEMLADTLKRYLPNIHDRSSRDSILTQVLYCAGSLGRLGADFSMILASLMDDKDESDEWVEVIRKHRVLAGRLELMVGSKDG